jgi:hypothetical protein
MSKRAPWQQRKGESAVAFAAFVAYRDMGPERSLSKVAKGGQVGGRTKHALEKWSAKHDWVARAEAWDQELDRHRTDAAAAEVEEMRRRHIQTAQGMQGLGVQELAKLVAKSEASPNAPAMTPEQTRWFLKDGTAMERLSLGEPTEVSQLKSDGDVQAALDNMTPEQIKLQKVLNKIARGEVLTDHEKAQLKAAGAE